MLLIFNQMNLAIKIKKFTKRMPLQIGISSEQNKKKILSPASPGLIVHCHGGGFVAQSSKSHEVYLRDWANTLDVPIISVGQFHFYFG